MNDWTKSVLVVVSDTGIVEGHTNGAKTRLVLFRVWDKGKYEAPGGNTPLFRISIRSESHGFQSFARLQQWTEEKGFQSIISKQPERDYGIDISYLRDYQQDAFDIMIDEMVSIAYKIAWP